MKCISLLFFLILSPMAFSQVNAEALRLALAKNAAEQKRIKRMVLLDQTKAYVINLPIDIVQSTPSNLAVCVKGAFKSAVSAGTQLCYAVYDTAYATTQGAKLLFGSESTKKQVELWIPKSGLWQSVKQNGWGGTITEMPRAVFESTVGNLLSGDPEKAGAFITNTALLLAPGPKVTNAVKGAARIVEPTSQLTFATEFGAFAPAMAATVEIDSTALAAITGAMVQETAAITSLGNIMMSEGGGRKIWMKWDCPSCGTKGISNKPINGELKKSCPTCGKNKPEGTKDYLTGERDSRGRIIDDADDVKGPTEGKAAAAKPDWNCPNCGGKNSALSLECPSCGQSQSAAKAVKETPSNVRKPISKSTSYAAGGASAVALGGAAHYLLHSVVVPGTLVDKSWTRTLHKMRFNQTTKRDWEDSINRQTPRMPVNGQGEIPGAFNLHDCRREFHHNDRVACGSHTVTHSGSCSYSDNGNGSATQRCSPDTTETVTDYCDYPVYKTKCSYETYEWQEVDSRSLSGTGDTNGILPWPEGLVPGTVEKLTRTESFSSIVAYTYKNRILTYDLKPTTESQYNENILNDNFILKVNRVAVRSVRKVSGDSSTGSDGVEKKDGKKSAQR